MPSLPLDWLSWTSGAVATHLMGLVPDGRLQTEVARCYISASLDLLTGHTSREEARPPEPGKGPELEWRVGDFLFLYVPATDDEALDRPLLAAERYGPNLNLILPPHSGRVFVHAPESLLGEPAPTIMELDHYVNLRILFAAIDFGWSPRHAKIELIEAYNRARSHRVPLLR